MGEYDWGQLTMVNLPQKLASEQKSQMVQSNLMLRDNEENSFI